jgi:enterochelin esterase-like enzyme
MKYTSVVFLLLFAITLLQAQNQKGTKERIKVHSQALEGNLIQDPAEREVTVYLPPSYQTQPNKRFPVLYMLHGFTDNDSKWFGWEKHWINLHELLDEALAKRQSEEMIVVMPNAYNRFKGSMYSSSATIGDWETFMSKELVEYIDSHYRTIPEANPAGAWPGIPWADTAPCAWA